MNLTEEERASLKDEKLPLLREFIDEYGDDFDTRTSAYVKLATVLRAERLAIQEVLLISMMRESVPMLPAMQPWQIASDNRQLRRLLPAV